MKMRIAALLTAAVTAAVMLPALPADAAEEYLVRDKWGYCRTAHYAESEHFVIFYGNDDRTGLVNDAFLKRNLEDYEKLWKCYGEFLGIDMMMDFLRTKGTLTDWQAGDFDENGLISAADFSLMKNAFAILNP